MLNFGPIVRLLLCIPRALRPNTTISDLACLLLLAWLLLLLLLLNLVHLLLGHNLLHHILLLIELLSYLLGVAG